MKTAGTTNDSLFDRFWQAYPRKVGKPQAMKVFANLRVTEETLSQMLAAITQQTKALGWEDKSKWKYIPHPTTWLNQRRWEDEVIGSDQQPDTADPGSGCCTVLQGSLAGYDCSKCKNKGYTAEIRDGEMITRRCSCMKTRETLRRIRESGLEAQLRECKFSSHETPEQWQQTMKEAVQNFIKCDAPGLFLGGQSGCGKTHLCTAAVGCFIKQGLSARYFVWREDSVILKGYLNDPEYASLIGEYKQTDVLYIDDLFKGGATDADKKLAFELIDYRCRNKLKTLISTELTEEELIGTDEALAGRIFKMSKNLFKILPKA